MDCLGHLETGWHRLAQCPCGLQHTAIEHEHAAHGSLDQISICHGPSIRALSEWRRRLGLPKLQSGPKPAMKPGTVQEGEWLLRLLETPTQDKRVEALADAAHVPPKVVRQTAALLRDAGYRVAVDETAIILTKVVPEAGRVFTASPALFDGEILRVGVVSDTHLGANEEALDELHAAYDVFKKEGITEVWHAGDWGTGIEMFRTHHAEAHIHTAADQVDYLVENYPRRDGIVTRGIAGNHDIEGGFGRIGFDPVASLARRRDDIDYLGEYGAWIELREGTGNYVHLLHGAGGMSYAYSYKAQKLVDGYPAGRKPSVLIVGHWHVRGDFQARNVNVIFPGCFEWQSRFMQRLGLQPTVGFHILEMRVAEDGSIVRWRPEWFQFYAGRQAAA